MSAFYVVSTEKIDGGWCIVVERADHFIRIGVEVWDADEAIATTSALNDAPDITAMLHPNDLVRV